MTQLEQLKAICEKQKELINVYKIYVIDVAPPKDKKVCENCKYFEQWGVVAGDCLHPDLDGESNRDENDTCHRFEKIEK